LGKRGLGRLRNDRMVSNEIRSGKPILIAAKVTAGRNDDASCPATVIRSGTIDQSAR